MLLLDVVRLVTIYWCEMIQDTIENCFRNSVANSNLENKSVNENVTNDVQEWAAFQQNIEIAFSDFENFDSSLAVFGE